MLWLNKYKKHYMPDINLSSERIILRPAQMSDWPLWVEVRLRNYKYLKPFEPRWNTSTLNEKSFEMRLKRQSKDWLQGKGQYFLIFLQDQTAKPHPLIGGMNINNICRGAAHFASLGYWLDEAHQGKGYMAEALQSIMKYAFSQLELHRLHGSCIPHNKRSQKVLLKAGFKEEGYAEKYLQIDGVWQDHILYGLPRELWLEQNLPCMEDKSKISKVI